MIELREIRKSYDVGKQKLEVLKSIDLNIETGKLVSIMGSSGSGKSTLLNIIGILDNYDSGVCVKFEKGDQVFDKREIQTGLSDGINIEKLGGLNPEDNIKKL